MRAYARPRAARPAARLGLRLVKGFNPQAAERIARRAGGAFVGRRPGPPRRAHHRAARPGLAGALASLAGHRRQAWWAAAGSQAAPGMLHDAPDPDTMPALPAPAKPRI
jgi:error-prone DNA polymerase